ncbi:nicotinamide riboside transporter PnuC [Arsenophonus symbiont of Ornithomya chloropus]|uniref:nicotinamide riboside transporter PnuC n=1 Tax=Arsenophonus symbiont of Ornithomya chloropus TaxID=634121 RepID=UPI0032B20E0C
MFGTDFFDTNNTMISIITGNKNYNLSYIEATATISGFLCVWLASQEKNINYFFGLINVICFAFIFFQIQLYASLLLQIFFFITNIYGWYAWSKVSSFNKKNLKIKWMSFHKKILISLITILTIVLLSLNIDKTFIFLSNLTIKILYLFNIYLEPIQIKPDEFPFLDSIITILSIIAMILMTRKYIENWLLWITINILSVVLFYLQDMLAIALEYFILLIFSINGFYHWRKLAF